MLDMKYTIVANILSVINLFCSCDVLGMFRIEEP